MPNIVIIQVTKTIIVIKVFDRRNASCFPFFSKYSLNIGIKLAEMAEANTASKNVLGILLAVINAAACAVTE